MERGLQEAFPEDKHKVTLVPTLYGKIHDYPAQLIARLNYAHFVIADVSFADPGVFWQLGVRMTLRNACMLTRLKETELKAAIQRFEKGDQGRMPRSLGHTQVHDYSLEEVAESVEDLAKEVKRTVDRVEVHGNPVWSYFRSEQMLRFLPHDGSYRQFRKIEDSLTRASRYGLAWQVAVQQLGRSQSLLASQAREGVVNVPRTAFAEFMKTAYANTTRIRCTSTESFAHLWDREYGKDLLKLSSNLPGSRTGMPAKRPMRTATSKSRAPRLPGSS